MATRKENERVYPHWTDLPDGGRRYWRDRAGGDFGRCRYVKIVDANETTIVQQIYDDAGYLIETHQKYPLDTGHRHLTKGELDDDPPDHS